MQIVDLTPEDQAAITQIARILVESFKEHWPNAWPNTEAATAEVRGSIGSDKISRIAIEDDGTILGWIGGLSDYNGNAWELHPLIVRRDRQGQGIGRTLVMDLERLVRQRGAVTLYLGTDDENNMTSLSGVNIYQDLTGAIANIQNINRHPYEFYQKLGFVIVGVIPDANGVGKPDIIMAKRIV